MGLLDTLYPDKQVKEGDYQRDVVEKPGPVTWKAVIMDTDYVQTNPPDPPTQHGHPRFYELTRQEEQLHSVKNHDYASGGDPLGNFHRVSSILALYPGLDLANPAVVALVYALKQWDAALWLLSQGHTPQVEGVSERLGDVSIYAKLARIMVEETTHE